MKKDCLFCNSRFRHEKKIVFFEDHYFFAVPDLFPVTTGHVLIIAKKHYSDFFTLPEAERKKIGDLIFNVGKLLQKTFACDGINVVVNNGRVAGQEIEHFHVHLVPRLSGDTKQTGGGVFSCFTKNEISKSEQILCAEKLKLNLNNFKN